MGQFALDIVAFTKHAKRAGDLVSRKVVLEVGSSLIEKSPVGDPDLWESPPPPGYVGGRFRANWQHGEGYMPSSQLPDIDPSGAATNARIMASVAPNAAGKIHFYVNNLPYAQRLEEGWSTQAPAGMVGLTVMQFQTYVNRAAASLK